MNIKDKYNEEPVEYCKLCNSLHITIEYDHLFCGQCGSIDFTGTTDINTWLEREKNNNKEIQD